MLVVLMLHIGTQLRVDMLFWMDTCSWLDVRDAMHLHLPCPACAGASTASSIPPVTTMGCPDVRIVGSASDVAIVSYQRLVQVYDTATKSIIIRTAMETRVWHKRGDTWKLAHFHRSKL